MYTVYILYTARSKVAHIYSDTDSFLACYAPLWPQKRMYIIHPTPKLNGSFLHRSDRMVGGKKWNVLIMFLTKPYGQSDPPNCLPPHYYVHTVVCSIHSMYTYVVYNYGDGM